MDFLKLLGQAPAPGLGGALVLKWFKIGQSGLKVSRISHLQSLASPWLGPAQPPAAPLSGLPLERGELGDTPRPLVLPEKDGFAPLTQNSYFTPLVSVTFRLRLFSVAVFNQHENCCFPTVRTPAWAAWHLPNFTPAGATEIQFNAALMPGIVTLCHQLPPPTTHL
jgi:hypothetical protein